MANETNKAQDYLLNHQGQSRVESMVNFASDEKARDVVEALKELVDIVQGHLDDGDVLDAFTLQVANNALAGWNARPAPSEDEKVEPKVRSCNTHKDCDAADKQYAAEYGHGARHCDVENCNDCRQDI